MALDRIKQLATGLKRYNPLYRALLHMRERRDQAFDRQMGLDTVSWVPVEKLDVPLESQADANFYAPTPAMYFNRIIRNAAVDPSDCTFVDLGSGKGRALLLAERAGFARVIGVEVDPELCRIARANAARWAELHTSAVPIEVRNEDARHFRFPPGNLLVYLFNPFQGQVFDEVIRNLTVAAQDASRELVIVYNNHLLADRFEATGAFERRNLRRLAAWRAPTVSYYRPKRPTRDRTDVPAHEGLA